MTYRLIEHKSYFFIIGSCIIFALIGLSGCDRQERIEQIWHTVKPGMKLYVDTAMLHDTTSIMVLLYRRIRPITASDIDTMNIPDWEKTKLLAQLKSVSGKKPYMIGANQCISTEKVFKLQTGLIGEYVKSDSVTAQVPPPPKQVWHTSSRKVNGRIVYRTYSYEKHLSTSPENWYAVKLNKKTTEEMPPGQLLPKYVYADDYYYLKPDDVELFESTIFKAKQVAKNSTADSEKW